MQIPENITTLLFDLDGVVFDTETNYTEFWKKELLHYLPGEKDIFAKIKGSTLNDIFERFFPDPQLQQQIVAAVDKFEREMSYNYVPGFEEYFRKVKTAGYKTAIVTSSNNRKMANIYARYPDFKEQFDVIVTADDIVRSKPDPYCFLLAADWLDSDVSECCVFEDSILGLQAARAAEMFVVGVATTNPYDVVKGMSDMVIKDFTELKP